MYASGFKRHMSALVLLLTLSLCPVPFQGFAGTPADGVLSAYIVGTYDNVRESLSTVIQVINPTSARLEIVAFFLDDNEHLLKCVREKLSPNDMVELRVAGLELKAEVGVVKIVAFKPGTKTPQVGIVGYKRTFAMKTLAAETGLYQIPVSVLLKELPRLFEMCPSK